MKETKLKESEKLLEAAKSVFGDIIQNAWITTYQLSTSKGSDVNKRLIKNEIDLSVTDRSIDYGCQTIVIQLTNGNKVTFESSEFALITRINNP